MSSVVRDDADVVAVNLAMALDLFRAETPDALSLLSLIAYLAPDDIPRRMLIEGREALPDGVGAFAASAKSLTDAIRALKREGLIEIVDASVKIHRSWQASMRAQFSGEERIWWATMAAQLALHQFPLDYEMRDWNWLRRLMPHTSAAIGHLEELGVAATLSADLRGRTSMFLCTEGQYDLAVDSLHVALASLPADGHSVRLRGRLLNVLAVAERQLGRFAKAKSHALEALALHRSAPAPTALAVGVRAPQSASSTVDAEAGAMQPQADDLDVADDLHNLGEISMVQGRWHEASQLLGESIRIRQDLQGDAAWQLTGAIRSYASAAFGRGDRDEGLAALRMVLDIYESSGRAQTAEADLTRQQLAVYDNPSDIQQFRKIMDIVKKNLGERHPDISESLRELGIILRIFGQFDEAAEVLNQANELDTGNFGPDSHRMARGRVQLMLLEAARGRVEQAEAELREAVRIVAASPPEEQAATFCRTTHETADDFATAAARPLVDRIIPVVAESGAAPDVVTEARRLVVEAKLLSGDRLLSSGDFTDAAYDYSTGRQLAALTEELFDDVLFEIRLGILADLDDDRDGVTRHFHEALRSLAEINADPVWTLIRLTGQLAAVAPGEGHVGAVVRALADQSRERGEMTEIHGSLSAAVPAEWYFKESITLVAPDGQANVIASSEPLDREVDIDTYATVQGDLLKKEFPQYVEHSFDRVTLFGKRDGYVRAFEWTPEDGVPVTQVQYYYVEDGRGYTATATTPSSNFASRELTLREILRGLRILKSRQG